MSKNVFTLFALFFLHAGVAFATVEAKTGVEALLSNEPVLRGEFFQEKMLQGFRNPLRSSGDFLISRDYGVIWDTQKPFASRTVLTKKSLFNQLPDGSRRVLLDAQSSPAMATVNSLLLAVVSGDLARLSQQFVRHEKFLADGAWTLRLIPREPALGKIIAEIELLGDRHIRSIRISERGGDKTLIRFVELREQPETLTSEEVSRFE